MKFFKREKNPVKIAREWQSMRINMQEIGMKKTEERALFSPFFFMLQENRKISNTEILLYIYILHYLNKSL